MSRIGASALSVVLAAILTLTVQTGVLILVVAVIVVVQGLLASAPAPADARGRSIPTPRSAATMSAGLVSCVVAMDPTLLLGADGSSVGQDGLVSTGVMAGILPGVAVGVFVALVAQMLRRDDRRELVLSTSSAISLALFASLASAWIGAARASSGPDVVTIAAVGLAASLLVWMIPIDRFVCGAIAVTVGAAASAVAALMVGGLPTWVFGVAVGSGTALFAILGQVLARAWSQGRVHASAGWGFPGAMAIAMAGPIVYLGGQLVTAGF
ncbi:hypothetical protein [Aeromicrobium sp.]|uniref:hypothetical protein n=1 Tax=Aeromicrobium sp. TaxID=1871063 RepID=UPI003C6B0505